MLFPVSHLGQYWSN